MKRIFLLLTLTVITSIAFSQTNVQVKEQQKVTKEKKIGGIYNYVDVKTAETLRLSKTYTNQEHT